MNRVDPEKFLARLQQVGVIGADEKRQIHAMRENEPTMVVSEAVREVKQLSEEQFLKLICEEYQSEYIPPKLLAEWPISEEATEIIGSQQAHDLAVFPLEYDAQKSRLLVVTAYPFNPHVLQDLDDILDVDTIEVTFCREATLAELLRRGYIGSTDMFGEIGDEGFDIGAASEEEAFPGIYGSSVSEFLYEMDEIEAATEAEGGGTPGGGGIRGAIEDLSVVEMLQPLGQNRKTCSIFVESGEEHASIYLQDGMVIHAEAGDISGEEAVYEALSWETGHFEILVRPYSGEPSMMQSVEGILLEGMRRLDEANR